MTRAASSALRAELEDWCVSYVTAFEAFDVAEIGRHWRFPAMVWNGARQLVMTDADSFDRNTGALTAFYKRQNAVRVSRVVLDAAEMGPETAMMRVADEIKTAEGAPVTNWVSAYVLRRTPDGWRAVFADAEGEAAAWAARGTPLGG